MKNKIFFLLLFFPLLAMAQERQLIAGKVFTGNNGVKEVLVVNVNAETETRTDSLGNFAIKAKMGDLLVCTDFKIETRKIRYTPDILQNNVALIEVKQAATELDEVVVNKYDFDAYKMGFTKTKVVLPTVAERRMASSGGDPVSALINVITGQGKFLKLAVEIEKRAMALDRLDNLFDDVFYREELKLEQDKIKGFKYYIVEDEEFRQTLNTAEEGIIKFALADFARQYAAIANTK